MSNQAFSVQLYKAVARLHLGRAASQLPINGDAANIKGTCRWDFFLYECYAERLLEALNPFAVIIKIRRLIFREVRNGTIK